MNAATKFLALLITVVGLCAGATSRADAEPILSPIELCADTASRDGIRAAEAAPDARAFDPGPVHVSYMRGRAARMHDTKHG